MNLWRQALQEYNSGKKYSIPKKGTPEYDEVKKIQDKLSKGSVSHYYAKEFITSISIIFFEI